MIPFEAMPWASTGIMTSSPALDSSRGAVMPVELSGPDAARAPELLQLPETSAINIASKSSPVIGVVIDAYMRFDGWKIHSPEWPPVRPMAYLAICPASNDET